MEESSDDFPELEAEDADVSDTVMICFSLENAEDVALDCDREIMTAVARKVSNINYKHKLLLR